MPVILDNLGLNKNKKKILILSGPTSTKDIARKIATSLEKKTWKIHSFPIPSCTEATIKEAENELLKTQSTLILSIGGGKVLDVGKILSARHAIDNINIPTTLSNDGICSPVAVITGEKHKHSIITTIPYGLIVDLKVIQKSPLRHLKAGIGDLLSNFSAIFDWQLAGKFKKDKLNKKAFILSKNACEHLLFYPNNKIREERFLATLARGLMLSGMAMNIVKSSRPASGSEHKISHAIDYLFPGRALHGEQVGLATRFTLYLQKNPYFEQVDQKMKKLGLPTRAKDINLKAEEFIKVVQYAPCIRKERYTVLEEKALNKKVIEKIAREIALI